METITIQLTVENKSEYKATLYYRNHQRTIKGYAKGSHTNITIQALITALQTIRIKAHIVIVTRDHHVRKLIETRKVTGKNKNAKRLVFQTLQKIQAASTTTKKPNAKQGH